MYYKTPKQELIEGVGNDCSLNSSPTTHGKLITVGSISCIWEVIKSKYSNSGIDKVGTFIEVPIAESWNAMYF